MQLKTLAIYIAIFFIWSGYRWLGAAFPIWFEELFIKGAVFGLPLLLFPLNSNKLNLKKLGISRNNFFNSVLFGMVLGIGLGLAGQVGSLLYHGRFSFSLAGTTSSVIGTFLALSLVTAFWEQLLFTGYFLSRVAKTIRSEIKQAIIVGAGFSLIHLPALLRIQTDSTYIIFNLGLLLSLGICCAILRLRLNNLIAPIMVHALWGVTVFLFN